MSFLIDCSGSMKAHIERVAMTVDILARALDQAGVASEVLGFTTGADGDGRARPDSALAFGAGPRISWPAERLPCGGSRMPPQTGGALAPMDRRAARGGSCHEGVDGEAVDGIWACRGGRRPGGGPLGGYRIVISDGSPMDKRPRGRPLPFPVWFLFPEAKRVARGMRALRDVEVLGLGVGPDPSPYYHGAASAAQTLSVPPR
ncbi:cobaltochelatase CobT-related protein [Cupriavidus basilensis]